MTRLALIITVLCAGCAAPGEPLAQIGGKNCPAAQIGSTTQPVLGEGSVKLNLAPTTSLNMQLGSKDGPLVAPGAVTIPLTLTVGKDAFNFSVVVPQGAVQLTTQVTVPMPDLTIPAVVLGVVIIGCVYFHARYTDHLRRKHP